MLGVVRVRVARQLREVGDYPGAWVPRVSEREKRESAHVGWLARSASWAVAGWLGLSPFFFLLFSLFCFFVKSNAF